MNVRYEVRFQFEVIVTTNHGIASVMNQYPFLGKVSCPQFESAHKITCNKYFYVCAETKEEAKAVAKKEFECFIQEEKIKLNKGYLMCIKEDIILDTTNSHDKNLVDKINYIWARVNEDRFKPILIALYQRDKEEAEEKGIEEIDEYTSFDSFAYEFMKSVCDDVDLAVIIDFIRFREPIPNSICNSSRTLYSDGWV